MCQSYNSKFARDTSPLLNAYSPQLIINNYFIVGYMSESNHAPTAQILGSITLDTGSSKSSFSHFTLRNIAVGSLKITQPIHRLNIANVQFVTRLSAPQYKSLEAKLSNEGSSAIVRYNCDYSHLVAHFSPLLVASTSMMTQ